VDGTEANDGRASEWSVGLGWGYQQSSRAAAAAPHTGTCPGQGQWPAIKFREIVGEMCGTSVTGLPLLIDPTAEDPWKYLFFDDKTGFITAIFDTAGNEDPKGKHTTDPKVLPLNIEAITMGRQRTRRNLVRAVKTFTNQIAAGLSLATARDEIIKAVLDNDDYGLAIWYFFKQGSNEEPFKSLKANHNVVWMDVQKSIA
jgi:hypothetical protein